MLNYQRVLISRTHVKHSGDMLQYLWSGARTCDDEVGKCNRRNHKHNSYNSSEQQQQFSNQEKIEKKTIKTIRIPAKIMVIVFSIFFEGFEHWYCLTSSHLIPKPLESLLRPGRAGKHGGSNRVLIRPFELWRFMWYHMIWYDRLW